MRTSGYTHDVVRLRDYIIYPDKPLDEDGEPTYPEVMGREQFERMFEEVE